VGAAITADWSAAPNHSAKDWIGLYAAGDADANYLSKQYISTATTGHLTVTAPLKPGTYELRLYQNDGFTLAATGNRFTVQ
jgi:hypothetical protein